MYPESFNAFKNEGTFSPRLPLFSTLAMTSTHNAPHCLPFTPRLRSNSDERGPFMQTKPEEDVIVGQSQRFKVT